MITQLEEVRTLGNKDLMALPKTVMLCSRDYPPGIEHSILLWAMEQRQLGHCIASGFHSQLEQNILRFLRQDVHQPIIYALGRGIQPGMRFDYEADLDAGHLLFVSPFEPDVITVTQETADIRNLLLADMADTFFIPYMTPGGNLARLLETRVACHKPLFTLDVPSNAARYNPQAQIYQPLSLLGGSQTNL